MRPLVARMLILITVALGIWLLFEIGMRLYVEWPLETDFYSSIPREAVRQRQQQVGVQVATGSGWAHLGWIADPQVETYRIERWEDDGWEEVGQAQFGSFLLRERGVYRVWAEPKDRDTARLLGEVTAVPDAGMPPLYVPRIVGAWETIFQPQIHGYYINDHTVYRDAEGNWRLVGITDKSDGNFNDEVYFAVGASEDFLPKNEDQDGGGMREVEPVADFGELAWAPHVIVEGETYYMFWSPHRLHRMTSPDGISWEDHRVVMPAPFHKFFRDPMVLRVAEGQWLLYTTARGTYYSHVDVYQSFDLEGWQYIGTALRSGWGSERNSPFASTESPFVTVYQGRYYLSLTYNNDSFFWPGILLTFHVWPNPTSYNETLVFHSGNPYDFGVYKGRGKSPTLLTQLEAHAPEIVYHSEQDVWYLTTAGWPWVATLTSGEVAVAPLCWDPVP
jgi:arabinan endo-1,5-alpha-L-arabinosidase